MTTHDYRPTPPTGEPGGAGSTTDQAKQAAGTAKDEGRHVADVARGEAQQVAGEAKQQARHLMDDARSQIEEQSRSQLDNLVSLLQGFGDDLERMVRGEGASGGLAQDVVSQVSDRAKSLSSQIQGREPAELLDQVRGFARRRPGTFLLGALAAGVVAGRIARGAKDAHSSGGSSSQAVTPTAPMAQTGTAADAPLAGTGAPETEAVYPEGTGTSASTWGTPAGPPDPTSPTSPTNPTGPTVDPTRGTP